MRVFFIYFFESVRAGIVSKDCSLCIDPFELFKARSSIAYILLSLLPLHLNVVWLGSNKKYTIFTLGLLDIHISCTFCANLKYQMETII